MGQNLSINIIYLSGVTSLLLSQLFVMISRSRYKQMKRLRVKSTKDFVNRRWDDDDDEVMIQGNLTTKQDTIPLNYFRTKTLMMNKEDVVINTPMTQIVNAREYKLEKFNGPINAIIDLLVTNLDRKYDNYYCKNSPIKLT